MKGAARGRSSQDECRQSLSSEAAGLWRERFRSGELLRGGALRVKCALLTTGSAAPFMRICRTTRPDFQVCVCHGVSYRSLETLGNCFAISNRPPESGKTLPPRPGFRFRRNLNQKIYHKFIIKMGVAL
jgi:hypothetical protein